MSLQYFMVGQTIESALFLSVGFTCVMAYMCILNSIIVGISGLVQYCIPKRGHVMQKLLTADVDFCNFVHFISLNFNLKM